MLRQLQYYITVICAAMACFTNSGSVAANFPEPVEGDYVIKDFTFHTGEKFGELKMHYYTVGDPANQPVLIIHGTTGTGKSMLSEGFAGKLFGPGEPLDASKYYLILPDSIGLGGSSKPSDGMRASYPSYNYDDMVDAQYRLITEGMGIKHLRAIVGFSMGGMHTWVFGIRYPDFTDALVPMASLPTAMGGRNWMMRRMVIDSVRNDPAWNNGNYTEQPPNLRIASVWFGIATSGGDQRLYKLGPNGRAASAYVDERIANQKVGDANDVMYRWDASRDFDPSADLGKITAHVLVINSADDERNPLSLGALEAAMPKIKHGEVYIVPDSPDTRGHGTTGGQAELYARQLGEFLARVPVKSE